MWSSPRSPAWSPFEEGRAAQPRGARRQRGPTVSNFGVHPEAGPGPAVSAWDTGHRTTLRTTGGFSLLSLPNAASCQLHLRACFQRTRPASEQLHDDPQSPACGLYPLGSPQREVLDRDLLQPAHIRSPAISLPTRLSDGGWSLEPTWWEYLHHGNWQTLQIRAFFFPGKLVVKHSPAHHYFCIMTGPDSSQRPALLHGMACREQKCGEEGALEEMQDKAADDSSKSRHSEGASRLPCSYGGWRCSGSSGR